MSTAGRHIFVGYTIAKTDPSSTVLVGYDYLLTVQRESRLFWRRRPNAASILFFTNRYLALVYYVVLAYYRCLPVPHSVSQIVANGVGIYSHSSSLL